MLNSSTHPLTDRINSYLKGQKASAPEWASLETAFTNGVLKVYSILDVPFLDYYFCELSDAAAYIDAVAPPDAEIEEMDADEPVPVTITASALRQLRVALALKDEGWSDDSPHWGSIYDDLCDTLTKLRAWIDALNWGPDTAALLSMIDASLKLAPKRDEAK